MGNRGHTISLGDWERYDRQFRALHKDWHYFHKLIEGYVQARFDSRELEVAFLQLKGRISCDYPVLAEWRNGGYGIPAAIGTIFDHGSTLKSLAADARNGGGRINGEWQSVDESLGKIRQTLNDVREKTKPGKPIKLPDELFAQHHSGQELEEYTKQFTAFRADWRRIGELVQASLHPGADRGALETELIQLKSKISCDYPVLPRWFGGRDEISTGLGRILSNGTSLAALADGIRNGGRMGLDWSTIDQSAARTYQDLERARTAMQNGKSTAIVSGFFVPPAKKRWNFEKILLRTGIACLILFVAATGYVMRNFLGFWAPPAGSGIEVNASLDDEQKVVSILSVMNEACVQGSVDKFMTTIANDFSDDEGNGRRALRVILQTYQTTGNMQQAWVDWKRTNVTRKDEWLYATPVVFRSEAEGEDDIIVRLGFKQYGERWLIAFAEGYN